MEGHEGGLAGAEDEKRQERDENAVGGVPVEDAAGPGKTVAEVCRRLEITENTYYRWKKEYGGLRVNQAKRLKQLEKENQQLKKLVADLSLDKQMLQDVISRKG